MGQHVNKGNPTIFYILWLVSFAHLMIDTSMSMVPALLPIYQESLEVSYFQLSFIVFVVTATGSLMQPLVGILMDRKPIPFLLPAGAMVTAIGVVGLAFVSTYSMILLMVTFIGIGAAIFHPEASMVAHVAAGNKKGLSHIHFSSWRECRPISRTFNDHIIIYPFRTRRSFMVNHTFDVHDCQSVVGGKMASAI